MDIPIENVHAWSDSSIVIAWLDGSPKRYKTFVGNRISIITQSIPPEAWKHVRTDLNPADCASRGISPLELKNHPMWWDGPSWLACDPIQLHSQPTEFELASLSTLELKAVVCNAATPEWIEHRFSSYHKLLCTTAWALRATHNFLAKKHDHTKRFDPYLTSSELVAAEHFLFIKSQQRSFPSDTARLTPQSLRSTSTLLSLSPTIGKDGLLRVGGRLSHANLSLSQTHPPILSGKDIQSNLLLKYKHVCLDHCGPSLLLAATGTHLHIVGARRLARTVCRQCVTCRKVSAKTENQLMGQLPAQRITPNPPFHITGVDYAGPFTLKKGHTCKPVLVKSYIVIFVCFSSKATHIEIVSDLTTEAFLAGLRRFVARRGLPLEIHSDNGTNFQGARNDLANLCRFLQSDTTTSSIRSYLLSQRVNWHSIPERAPHFGGLWEAAVKSAKYHLRQVVGTQRLTYEEFSTVTCQVEACLNSRPLASITSHASDGISALTPGHFLTGRPLKAYPETLITQEPSMLKRWNLCQALTHHFWKRWANEYLQQLQKLRKWKTPTDNLQPGDIVVLRDDTAFVCHWKCWKPFQAEMV